MLGSCLVQADGFVSEGPLPCLPATCVARQVTQMPSVCLPAALPPTPAGIAAPALCRPQLGRSVTEYIGAANDEVTLLIQVETRQCYEDLEVRAAHRFPLELGIGGPQTC